MRKIVNRAFWMWDFDEEEKWLNQMAAKGLCLVGVGFFRYEFEDCEPGEYVIRKECLEKRAYHPESQKYVEFLEGIGAEQVGSWINWIYLRRKKSEGEFELHSDNESKIKHLTRIRNWNIFIFAIFAANVAIQLYYLIRHGNLILSSLYIPFVALFVLSLVGLIKTSRKLRKLKKDRQLFE